MHRKSFIGVFLLAGLLIASGSPAVSRSGRPQSFFDRSKANDLKSVEFRGISFKYPADLFGAVKSEEISEKLLEYETDKPEGVAPRHVLFTLQNATGRPATIAVYPVADFRRVWVPVEKNNSYLFDTELENLRKVIADKNYRRRGEVPYLVWYDAHQAFSARVTPASFASGRGVFFLTQINQDQTLVNNEQLEYIFQGLTADEKYYVLAAFPVSVSFLPASPGAVEFEGYRIPSNFITNKAAQERFDKYLKKLSNRLEALPPGEFTPHLSRIEELTASLKIEN